MNNKLLILGIILLVLIIIQFNMTEGFTQKEYLNYQDLLNDNCKRSSEVFNKLKKMNSYRCGKKGNTERETINNKTICYDDTAKEIVAGLDTKSYCKMAKQVSKESKKSEKSEISKESKIYEGPNFINNFYVDSYNAKKLDDFSMFDNSESKPLHNYPVSSSYSNISFSSDPAFLSRLNNKK